MTETIYSEEEFRLHVLSVVDKGDDIFEHFQELHESRGWSA